MEETGQEWKSKKIRELAKYVNRGISPKYVEQNGVVVINQKCIRDNRVLFEKSRFTDPEKKKISDEKYVQKYDVLVNSTGVGTLGRVAQVLELKQKMTVDSHVTIVRPNDSINPLYFGYCMILKQPDIERMGEGATGQTELSRNRIKDDIELPIPPSKEQEEKIASILFNYDGLIDNNSRRIQLLEQMAKLIYDEWFVKFKFPGHEKVKMVESEIGEIPEGWRVGKISDLYSVQPGFAFKSKDFYDTGFSVIKITNIQDNHDIDICNCDKILEEVAAAQTRFIIKNGDVLIAMTGATIGKVGIFHSKSEQCYLNQRVARFLSKKTEIPTAYIFLFSIGETFRKTIQNISLGAAQPNISGTYIENISMILPSNDVLQKFGEIVQPLLIQIGNLRGKNRNLATIRDLLLPKLISGGIDVSNIDIKISTEET